MKELNNDQIKHNVRSFKGKAHEYIKDRNKAKRLLEELKKKSNVENGRIQTFKEQLILLMDAYEDWISGRYRKIPYKSLTMIVIGILYFIIPIDFIPDILIGAGYIDDAAILLYVIKQIKGDLDDYQHWKQSSTTTIVEETIEE
ncbi:YkvA family protein [Bacillus salitolerans]|uniref:YkvA family protein n=1 Tax=Bacillus salitolerans TaxID=1437434 RepID=A0ABW4LK65_9BACI